MTSPIRIAARVVAVTAAILCFCAPPLRIASAGDGPPREGEGEDGASIGEKIKA